MPKQILKIYPARLESKSDRFVVHSRLVKLHTYLTGVFLLLAIFFMLPNFAKAADKLLQQTDLNYLGAFKIPAGDFGSPQWHGFTSGGRNIAYNQTNNSLFMEGRYVDSLVAEISIPTLVDSTNINALNTATVLQNFTDPTEGNLNNISVDGSAYTQSVYIGGLLVYGGRLIGSAYAYYDASNETKLSHFTRSKSLTAPSFSGMWQVGTNPDPVIDCGFVSGSMAEIPDNTSMGGTNWKAMLGGPALTISPAGASIVSRLSHGPSVFVFDPARLGIDNPVATSAYVYYDYPNHMTLGDASGSGGLGLYDSATIIDGVVFPFGSKSILYFGRKGTGAWHYGYGTNDITQAGPPVAGAMCKNHLMDQGDVTANDYCAYDPTAESKGPHSYPYDYFVWSYDADDLLKVKNGDINPGTGQTWKPWEIIPNATWSFDLPFQSMTVDSNNQPVKGIAQINGATYDPATQRIFVSQGEGNGDLPVVHVFQVNLAASVSDTTAPSAPSGLSVQ